MKPLFSISIAVLFAASTLTTSVFAGDQSKRHRGDHDRYEYSRHDDDRGYKNKHHRKHNRKHDRQEYARVIRVKPIYKTVTTNRPDVQCWREPVRQQYRQHVRTNNAGDVIAGSIIGGVIGHHLGNQQNHHITTLFGSLMGAAIASEASGGYVEHSYREQHAKPRKHCRTINHYVEEKQLKGYKVVYKYKGDVYKTRMREHPGKRIPIDVNVRPRKNWY